MLLKYFLLSFPVAFNSSPAELLKFLNLSTKHFLMKLQKIQFFMEQIFSDFISKSQRLHNIYLNISCSLRSLNAYKNSLSQFLSLFGFLWKYLVRWSLIFDFLLRARMFCSSKVFKSFSNDIKEISSMFWTFGLSNDSLLTECLCGKAFKLFKFRHVVAFVDRLRCRIEPSLRMKAKILCLQ